MKQTDVISNNYFKKYYRKVDLMVKKWSAKDWADAKKRCKLNASEIQMAKELGFTPKGLIKNIPTTDQRWKAPVNIWIRDLYEEKFGEVLSPQKEKQSVVVSEDLNDDDNLPF